MKKVVIYEKWGFIRPNKYATMDLGAQHYAKKKGEKAMKKNPYATNQGGQIKAPNKPKDQPKATVKKSDKDLRSK